MSKVTLIEAIKRQFLLIDEIGNGLLYSASYLCSFRPKPSDVHPKPSDVHQKPSDAHQKASDGKLIAMETVATTPKIVSAEEYSRKPFTLHFLNLSISVAEG